MTEDADPDRVVTREHLARELTLLRHQAGKTIRDLGKAVGVPFGTLGGWFRGANLPLAAQTAQFENVLIACGVRDPAARERWMRALLRVRRLPGRRAGSEAVPYRGLECFQPEHADWFFGRDALTRELLGRIDGTPGTMIVAVGPSGSGKSSLLRAGLIARLKMPWALLCPGAHPMRELARSSPADVVIVDQFEEVFTACSDEAERSAFIEALRAHPGTVVLGMRADFYPRALRDPRLASALQANQVVVGPMTEAELRSVIEGPARRAQLDIEDGLVELVIRDVSEGALPLLSHTLLTTWEHRRGRVLTVEDYRASGGLDSAVARTAEDVYADLTEEQREVARRLFIRLIHIGADTADTRRRVEMSELPSDDLDHVLDCFVGRRLLTVDADTVQISHEALLAAWPRLRSWIDSDRAGLRAHRQLTEAAQAWQAGNREPGALYRGGRLDAAREWAAEHRDDLNPLEREFLDASVEQVEAQAATERWRTRRLHRLLAALVALTLFTVGLAVYSQVQRAEADQTRDIAVSRQLAVTANRLRDSDPALAAQLAVAAYRISPTVEARSGLMEISGTPSVTRAVRPGGVLQALVVSPRGDLMAAAGADGRDPSVLLWSLADPARPRRVGAPLRGHTDAVYAAAFSPDGRTLATAGVDHSVRLWNVANPLSPTPIGTPLTGPADTVFALAFSPDGRTLAAGGALVYRWDVTDLARHTPLAALPVVADGSVRSLAFRADGGVLAAGLHVGTEGAVQLWRSDRALPLIRVPTRVNVVAFRPGGTLLAAGCNDGSVRRWETTSAAAAVGKPLTGGVGAWVNAIAFNGDTMAVGSADNTTRLWDLTTGEVTQTLAHPEPVTAVAYRDDRTLVTNSADSVVRLWTLPGPQIPSGSHPITTVAFRLGGNILAASGEVVRLWDVTDHQRPAPIGPPLAAPLGYDRMGGNVALRPDGGLLAAGTRTGNVVVLWDITDPHHPVRLGEPLTGATALIESVQFGPGGRLLAAAGDDGTVQLWDVTEPRAPRRLPALTPAAGFIFMIAFSPDGHTLAAATQAGVVALWDVSDPRAPVALRPLPTVPGDDVYSVAFNPGGGALASGNASGAIRLWDLRDPRHPRLTGKPLTGPDGRVFALAYGSDGRTLAAGTGAGETWIWDLGKTGTPSTRVVLHTTGAANWILAFASDGRTLASASGAVRLWDTDVSRIATRICASAGDPMTETEWHKYASDTPFRPPCP
ncbi:nSTAND1 domain-containing NTPase [Nonomuraea sediminis]|uniref:nSTAND1 domain-containing NTPase n=1 Tax=Nonomuraea sediminis TaxID=2835864 RepID=UPI001BDD7C36|nr:WD40 repeat domain-containing protein [Nonomuraea sediminis]